MSETCENCSHWDPSATGGVCFLRVEAARPGYTCCEWIPAPGYDRIVDLEAERDAWLDRASVLLLKNAKAEARAMAAEARALDLERRLAAALERAAPPSHTAPVDDAADAACRACEVWRRSK